MTRKWATWLTAIVLVLVPFYAFLTVFGSSLVGHYTVLRLWDAVLLLFLFLLAGFWLIRDSELRRWFFKSLLVRLILIYTTLTAVLGVIALARGDVGCKALAYGLLVNLRFLAWFLAVLLTAQRSGWLRRQWPRLLLIPAALVVIFAVLQYTILPHTFLSHFGYNAQTTIAPIETINHNPHYIRVQSFLRGANPLGAYLVIIAAALAGLFLRPPQFLRGKRRVLAALFGVAALAALYASGSRSAWIGAVLAVATVLLMSLKSARTRAVFGIACAAIVLAGIGGYAVLHNNARLQNEVLHTQSSSTTTGSDQAHVSNLKSGLHDVLHQPLGDGPGTAGPASVYNTKRPARITDDYYLQIAQETGWLGLVLFMSILVLVGVELYARAPASRLSLILLASLIGVSFVNLLSHAWADDTLAFIWWGLAGIALAKPTGRQS